MGMFWIITLMVVSTIFSIYIYVSKNLNVIASIEPEKIPNNFEEKIIKYFIITLIIVTILICLSIYFLDKDSIILGIVMIIASLIVSIPFYIYYSKIISR